MDRGGYLRCIDCVGIELESLFLFLLFREKCCCVRHGCILFFESILIAKDKKWDPVGRLIKWDGPRCKKGERQFEFCFPGRWAACFVWWGMFRFARRRLVFLAVPISCDTTTRLVMSPNFAPVSRMIRIQIGKIPRGTVRRETLTFCVNHTPKLSSNQKRIPNASKP